MTKELIYCIVAGSRKFNDFELMCERLDDIFKAPVARGAVITIISGTARGADTLGEQYAKLRNHHLVRMPADWNKHGRSAGYKRNEEMAKRATHLVAFWDGNTERSGTHHMINIGKEHRLRSRVVMFKP